MSWEIFFILGLLVFAIASFLVERYPTDQIALTIFAILLAMSFLPFEHKLPKVNDLLTVFSNPAPLTIAAMFILSAALERTGAIKNLASYLDRLATLGYRQFLLVMILGVAAASAFINNTPIVMVFMPVVLSLSRKMSVPASKLLIPLSYASIFGGTCTLVGTSTNILASSILEKANEPPIGMFELASVGLPLLFIGTLYLTFFADKVLPVRETLTSILSEEERKEFITEAFVRLGSPLAGKTVKESPLHKQHGVRVLEIIRDEIEIRVDPKTTILQEGDRLVLACRPSGFAHTRSIDGIDLRVTREIGLETISAHEGSIVEGVIGPSSTIIGKTVREVAFRQRFRVILMAIHRRGVNLRKKIGQVRFQAGDLLLMMGTEPAVNQLRKSEDLFLLDHPHTPAKSQRRKMPWVLLTVVGVIVAASLNLLPIVAAALIGAAVIFLTGTIKPKDGYASIEWSILFLIYGMLALGRAMETSGTAALLARGLTKVAELGIFAESWKPYILLALIYLATMIMTETLSNNATVVLMTPLALSLGAQLGLDPRAFVIATCIAASASFSTPIGYQTNTYIYGVAGYRFSDFTRAGLPLNLIYFSVSIFLIPRIWTF